MKKILLIEDNEDVRENTADILALAHYQVEMAENGKIGVEKAKQFHPDIVVCDIMMPEMDGYGVLEQLSKNSATASTPFIFLTAKTDRADMRTGMNLGADDYLTKPFDEKELLEAISSRLRKNEFLKKEFAKNVKDLNVFLEEASQYMDLESLSKGQALKKYDKKDMLYWEGDTAHSMFFVESGRVKTYKGTESGKEFVSGICGPGEFIGQLSLLGPKGTYIDNAVVLEDAELYAIPKRDFTKLLNENHTVSQKFIEMISNNLIEVQAQLVGMAFASVRQRAAKTLLDLYDKGIIKDYASEGMGIPREDFAGLIGTATETAIRTLSDFKEEGLITTDSGRRIIILKKEELQSIADFR
ncbi:cAMP-binding domain of CRP or a regulatory subunit of cAMP-dependent protein kinases [Pricia antarctica]|uniref:cAMP-binding domain of CRP or a regulatory subunit of cAMP-dependent protein kinases n=1 Tax=Pricia antarctica TaxID=641691 RepID=A0A1G7C4Y0_9FLAO|nr:response regulator [Pricia antarctica]SDE34359.1 cAMP-binding domain of CRP or a regulatory subunit of cAMP-dependent protein kinases [Pricia antarctica]